MPGEPKDRPPRQNHSVLFPPISPETLDVVVPRPPVHLDSHPLLGKPKIELGAAHPVVLSPAGQARLAQQPDHRPLGRRGRTVRRSRKQSTGCGRSASAEIAALRTAQGVELHPSLQRTIHWLRAATTQRHRRLQHGQGYVGDPLAARSYSIDRRQIAAPNPDPTATAQPSTRWHRDLHGGRRIRPQSVPPRGSQAADRGTVASPQSDRANSGFSSEGAVSHRIDARIDRQSPARGEQAIDLI